MFTATPPEILAEEHRRAKEHYDRRVRPILRPEDNNKYVAVGVESGDFEIDEDDYTAGKRLLARRPGERQWLFRVGWAGTYSFGGYAIACER